MKKLGFFVAFILPVSVIVSVYRGGWWTFEPIVFAFIILPIIDQLSGLDTSNPEESDTKQLGDDFYYKFVTFIWTYLQIGMLVWACYIVSIDMITTPVEWVGFTVSFSLVTGGIGITVAHELGHKKAAIERFYGRMLLMTVSYMHFYIEHNRGHHVHVATPEDPATAVKDENFYKFWIKSVFKGYGHAWRIENGSLRRKDERVFSFKNEMIWYTALPVLFCAGLTAVFSIQQGQLLWAIPIFFFTQSFLAFTLLELVNYVEHYGIVRKEVEPGKYERVNPLHSWNASHRISNFFLFQLQRHSDHHVTAIKRYQLLKHYDESPQLPFGYPTMILIALLPPLWFLMMNPRLEEWSARSYEAAQ